MYELIPVSERCYYVSCPSKIGIVVLDDGTACTIDAGSDKDAAKKVKKHLDANGWQLRAVYTTHSNADHIGGCKYLADQTGCEIYAPGIECALTRHPVLEPAYLYGGYPPKALRGKFFMAEPSDAKLLTPEALPAGLEIIDLPGHFFDMVGYLTPDGTAYIADCLSSAATLEKYGIGVVYDVAAYLDTLEKVKRLDAKIFVPSHAEPTADIAPLCDLNAAKVREIAARIVSLCAEPITFDALLAALFEAYGMRMTVEQHALVGSTVRSYLAYLADAGEIEAQIDANRLVWVRR